MNNRQLSRSWSSESAVKYYSTHRDSVKELYRSEKHFIRDILKGGRTVLDIGCAAGGFSKILRKYNKDMEYTGVDISPQMITEARKRFPESKFYVCAGETLDFPDNSFDVCICFGVLHMTESWKRLLAEAWRVCGRTLLFDLRTVDTEGVCDGGVSYQRLAFGVKSKGISKAPYVVVNIEEAIKCIIKMRPPLRSLRSYGYWSPVSKTVISIYEDVCMSVFCLGKNGIGNVFDWRLPLGSPGDLKRKISGGIKNGNKK